MKQSVYIEHIIIIQFIIIRSQLLLIVRARGLVCVYAFIMTTMTRDVLLSDSEGYRPDRGVRFW